MSKITLSLPGEGVQDLKDGWGGEGEKQPTQMLANLARVPKSSLLFGT